MPFISYRGHAREDWELLPSLCRNQAKNLPIHHLERFESEIIREFRTRFELRDDWTEVEVLAFARHHGAPTRLLDWSTNPLIGLWFAVEDRQHDSCQGVVYQMFCPGSDKTVRVSTIPTGPAACKCGVPVHVFRSPAKIGRSDRQMSVFSLTAFEGGHAVKPLDLVGLPGEPVKILKHSVPAQMKPKLRQLLSDVGLDAHSIYGDPDSFGRAVTAKYEVFLNVTAEVPFQKPTQAT